MPKLRCGEAFDANHFLDCKNGGLVYQKHNALRDENIDLNRKAGFSKVLCKPIVQEADKKWELDAAIFLYSLYFICKSIIQKWVSSLQDRLYIPVKIVLNIMFI